jgi:hypothetical protein
MRKNGANYELFRKSLRAGTSSAGAEDLLIA